MYYTHLHYLIDIICTEIWRREDRSPSVLVTPRTADSLNTLRGAARCVIKTSPTPEKNAPAKPYIQLLKSNGIGITTLQG